MRLGTGIGWRPEIADGIAALPGIDWVEVVAENVCPDPDHLPDGLRRLRERGTTVVPHGVSLGIGGAELPDPARLSALAERAEALDAPLVTEHIAFVRAGGPPTGVPRMEAGHLLPVPRTRDALDVLCENVRVAQEALPVPLALENIAALVAWPGEELSEGAFLAELVERTGVRLLIDVANLHTNHVNRGEDPCAALDELPLDALAYVHVAGGFERDGVWHDSHGHPVTRPVLDVLAQLRARTEPPGVLLERDENFPPVSELAEELESIRSVLQDTAPARELREPREPGTLPAGGAGPGEERRGRATASAATETRQRPAQAQDRLAQARERLARAEAGLLAALVADAPAPEGFDRERLDVQRRALAAKRRDVVAKVAPELPSILGEKTFRSAFAAYARTVPLTGGYRRDALDFAAYTLDEGAAGGRRTHGRLRTWWLERSAPEPPPGGRVRRMLHLTRERVRMHR
ncbi:DUF692 family protein [Streptomyces sp. HNM0575]|nr:DUF692 family protein [Streptomyces sp. HNM0575]